MPWVCTKCKEPSANVPDLLLLDATYGSMRCLSGTCKRQKRVFHMEEAGRDRPLPRKESS